MHRKSYWNINCIMHNYTLYDIKMKCIYKCTGILTILIYLSSLNIIFSYNKLSAQNRYTTSLIKQKYKKTSLYSSRPGYLDSIISSNKLNKLNVKLSSIINPVIFGGLLSGGLHAITGDKKVNFTLYLHNSILI